MFRRPCTAARPFACLAVSMLVAVTTLWLVSPAFAGPGYALDQGQPSIATTLQVPRGVAIDQSTQQLYVTDLVASRTSGGAGQVEQFDAGGNRTANSPFVTHEESFFAGVAVNPVNHNIYAYQIQLSALGQTFGTAKMDTFSSTGVPGPSFVPPKSKAPQLAADATGRVYLPNDSTSSVQIFSASGTLEDAIPCTGCPGGAFGEPTSVALDSAGNLYVVDLPAGGRVIKFKPSGGSYVYDSVLQSGRGAAAVGVDPSSDDVFVGDLGETGYHVVAYDSTGAQFDDFGGGLFEPPAIGPPLAGQIAVNATTHKVYVADSGANKVWIFDRIASIPAPTASTDPADEVGQLEANLNSTVDPNGHGLTACHFEYTDAADFDANGFANAQQLPCPPTVGSSTPTAVSSHLGGLTPSTEYDYRIAVTTNGGSAKGASQAFTSLPPLPPTVTTGVASSITQTSAKVVGSVNPNGGKISGCSFEYVAGGDFLESGFAKALSVDCPTKPAGTTSTPVSAKLTGLKAETDYHVRVAATNNSGTTQATDSPFTTLANTCQTESKLCPPPVEETFPPVSFNPGPLQPTPAVLPRPSFPKRLTCRRGFKKKKVHGKAKCVKVKKKRRAR